MGHVRLGRLPSTRKWNDVVALLGEGAPVDDIAGASADAAEASLSAAHNDPALLQAFWLLTQLPLAARSGAFERSLASLGLRVPDNPGLSDVLGAVAESIDRQAILVGGRTDLGELAQSALIQSLASVVGGNCRSFSDRLARMCDQPWADLPAGNLSAAWRASS